MKHAASPPAVIGHRGAAGHAPENTLASVEKAAELGVRWVEVDIKLSRDAVPMVFHDETLQRTTGMAGKVAEMDCAALTQLDAGAWFAPEFAGETVPTLEQLVALLRRLDMGLNLELKPCKGREAETGRVVAEVFSALWPDVLPAPVISSFKPDALAAFGAAVPTMERALLVHRVPADWMAQVKQLSAAAIHIDVRHIKRHHVSEMRAAGLAVRCYTVNDRDDAMRLRQWGVQSLITDFPDRLAGLET